jgi:hypothetical protein
VKTDNDGGLISELLYLPDLTKKRQARPYNFLAKHDTSFTFEKGVLTSSSSDADATAVPKAVVGALEKIAMEGVKAFTKGVLNQREGAEDEQPEYSRRLPDVYLFKIVKRPVRGDEKDSEARTEWGLIGAEGGGNVY